MSDNAIDRLKEMVNKPFLYQNEEIVILNYCDGTGDDGTEVEIYLNNGKVLIFSMFDLASKLNRFRSITNTVVVLANERLNKVSESYYLTGYERLGFTTNKGRERRS